jgi:hypothetical protein
MSSVDPLPSVNRMTTISVNRSRRPLAIWGASATLAVLALLSAVGGYLFNLAEADELDDYLTGGAFLVVALVYLAAALRVPVGAETWRRVAIGLAVAHGLFNAVVKVGIEGETVSLMFVGLTGVVVALLSLPASRAFFRRDAGPGWT